MVNFSSSHRLLIIFILLILFLTAVAVFVFRFFPVKQGEITTPSVKKVEVFKCPVTPVEEFDIGVLPDRTRGKEAAKLLDETNRELLFKLAQYEKFGNSALVKEIQNLAGLRKQYLVEIAYRNPDTALFSLLLDTDREKLAGFSENCVEREETVEGVLEVLHVDFEDGNAETIYRLRLADGSMLSLHPAQGLYLPLESGAKVSVKGVRIDDEIIFNGSKSLKDARDFSGGVELIKDAGNPPVFGDQKIIVIMANFKNTLQPNVTQEEVRRVLFGEVNRYYQEVSYGSVSLSGEISDWFTLPINQSCNAEKTWNSAIQTADSKIDFRNFSRVIVIAPLGPKCGWGGFATTGKTTKSVAEGIVPVSIAAIRTEYVNLQTLGHELGHNFGNHHAGFLDCGSVSIASDGCVFSEYGDLYDIMGKKNTAHQNALHKERVGWLKPSQIKIVRESGDFTIEPIETASNNLKAIKIQRGVNDFLFVEYRQPIGFDKTIFSDANVFRGALLHIKEPGGPAHRSALIDPTPPANVKNVALLPGMSFRDSASGAVITVMSALSDALMVKVKAGRISFTPPEVNITYPVGQPVVSGKITVFASVSHPTSIDRVEFYYMKQGGPVLFGTDKTEPYEAELDTRELSEGTNYIQARAFDSSGNEGISNIAGFSVRNVEIRKPVIISSIPATVSKKEAEIAPVLPVERTARRIQAVSLSKGLVGVEYEASVVDVDMGLGPFTYSISSGYADEFPPGLTLDQKSGIISGAPSEHGVWDFRVKITDRNGAATFKDFSIEIKPRIAISTKSLPEATVGVPYKAVLSLIGSGGEPYKWRIPPEYGLFPPGLNLDSANGVISGTPSEDGAWGFTVGVEDKIGASTQRDFKIEVRQALFIFTKSLPSGFVGEYYSASLEVSGSGDSPYKWSVPAEYGTFPPGLSLEHSGKISGTPSEKGEWGFTAAVVDSSGRRLARDFKISIGSPVAARPTRYVAPPTPNSILPPVSGGKNIPPPPVSTDYLFITSSSLPNATSGVPYLFRFSVSGGKSPYIWTVDEGSNLPAGLSLDRSSGVLSGTINQENPSYASLEIKVTDSKGLSQTSYFSLEIRVPPSITVLYPNGGEKLLFNSPLDIKWKANLVWSKISVQVKDAATGDMLFEKKDFYAYGSYSWTPTGVKAVSSAKVIVSAPDLGISDESDSPFGLEIPQGLITIKGKFINRFTGVPLKDMEVSGPNSSGISVPQAKSSATGEFSILVDPPGAISGRRHFWYEYGCYGQSGFWLEKKADGSMELSSYPFDPSGYSLKKFPVEGSVVDMGDIPFWPAADLDITSDIPAKFSIEYAGGGTVYSSIDYKNSYSFSSNYAPLNHDFRIRFTDVSGKIYLSPYVKFRLNHDCTPLSLNFSGGNFSWSPDSSIVPPEITTGDLPSGSSGTGVFYKAEFKASGGVGPYTWSMASGKLPEGLVFDGILANVSGVPLSPGSFPFGVKVTDSRGVSSEKPFVIDIKAPGFSSLLAPTAIEANWMRNFGSNTLNRSVIFQYASTGIAQTSSFRLYEKKPGSAVFAFADEFANISSTSCGKSIGASSWTLRRDYLWSGGVSICGGNDRWIIEEKGPNGYFGYHPMSRYPVGEYSYYLVAVDTNGDISSNSSTISHHLLDLLTILSPTETQSPLSGTTTFQWTVASGWPSAATAPYNVSLHNGTSWFWTKSRLGLNGSFVYNGPALDSAKQYSVYMYGLYEAPDKTEYLSLNSATTTFWISPVTSWFDRGHLEIPFRYEMAEF